LQSSLAPHVRLLSMRPVVSSSHTVVPYLLVSTVAGVMSLGMHTSEPGADSTVMRALFDQFLATVALLVDGDVQPTAVHGLPVVDVRAAAE
jgi:hypothetical protein